MATPKHSAEYVAKHAAKDVAGLVATHDAEFVAQRTAKHAGVSLAAQRRQRLVKTALGATLAVVIAMPMAAVPQLALADAKDMPQASGVVEDGTCDKQEVVYAKLSAKGAAKSLYVVNSFDGVNGETVKDYGSYSDAVNLSDSQDMMKGPDSVSFVMQKDSFSYQGNLKTTDLPWNVAISYYLDGQAIEPEDLAGKDGQLRMSLNFTKNGAVDSRYFDNYLVQATVALPQDNARNVKTQDGAIAVSGANTQVTFMSLPGKEATCELTAEVSNFEMDGISIAAVPFSMNIDFSTDGLASQFDPLIEGTASLNEGAQAIAKGSSALEVGAAQLASGATQLSEQGPALAGKVDEYLGTVAMLQQKVSALSSKSSALVSGAQQTQKALNGFAASLTEEQKAMLSPEQLAMLQGAQQGMNGDNGLVAGITAYTEGITGTGTQQNPALASVLGQLTSNNKKISDGVESYTAGVSTLASNLNDLAGSTTVLSEGAEQVASGSHELATSVQGIPDKLQKEIDEALAAFDTSSFAPKSYVSDKNADVSLVQFVLMTDPIKVEEVAEDPDPEPEKSFLDRLLALFQ